MSSGSTAPGGQRQRGVMLDVVIIGGGPAGLSAGLVLGRCRRKVVIVDDGRPRNGAAQKAHGFFTRDGVKPEALLAEGRAQLRPYGVKLLRAHATSAQKRPDGTFEVTLEGGRAPLRARRLLIASGLRDRLPDLEGAREVYGRGLYHCPYCDGWEVRDQKLAALGADAHAAEEALGLKTWSPQVVLLTHGRPRLSAELVRRLTRNGIRIHSERILRLVARRGRLARVELETGPLELDALFFQPKPEQRCVIAGSLGCAFTRHGTIKTGKGESTTVEGLFAAGDASRDIQQISVAVAEGAKAAITINKSLRREDER